MYIKKKTQLEAAKHTYKYFGNYWIELADCYYQLGEYQKCLDCVATYYDVAADIFRDDVNLVSILPKAIVAAREIYRDDEYVSVAKDFADTILDNVEDDNWSVRYFVAQVYVELFSETEDDELLWKAYDLVKTNVSYLVDGQRTLNDTYLAEVQEVEYSEPEYGDATKDEKAKLQDKYKAEKKRIDAYNKQLKETRKTELLTVYEPLVVNCDLLFALAGELDFDDAKRADITGLLNEVFLSKPVKARYSFAYEVPVCELAFEKDTMVIPADYLTQGATYVVTLVNDGEAKVYTDWNITKVERESKSVSEFKAYISSEEIKGAEWSVGTEVTIEIYNGDDYEPFVMKYRVTDYKDKKIGADDISFEPM